MIKVIQYKFEAIKFFLKNILYNSFCQYCKKKIIFDKEYNSICYLCIKSIIPVSPIKHKNTNFPLYSLGKYDGVLRYIITLKYRKNEIGYYSLTENILHLIDFFYIDFDVILLVPKTVQNKIKQQVNPLFVIANILKKNSSNKIIFDNVYIRSQKEDQAGKRHKDRIKMNNDIFFIPNLEKKFLHNKKILIIDDVYTTGSTIDAMINSLSGIKYISLKIFVLARK